MHGLQGGGCGQGGSVSGPIEGYEVRPMQGDQNGGRCRVVYVYVDGEPGPRLLYLYVDGRMGAWGWP